MIYFKDLEQITGGEIVSLDNNGIVKYLITDSRKSFFAVGGIFFAISGEIHNGHDYIQLLYNKGVRQFVIEQDKNVAELKGCNVLKVKNTLFALQALVGYHRTLFNAEVIGITGSNGKTIIKEWLAQLLAPYKRLVKNPHSYNSQIGVPISVWQMNDQHELGIFEAGISQAGEMERLEPVIKPTVGIFTNIGPAHDAGFKSRDEKIIEKTRLFKDCPLVIYCKDQEAVDQHLNAKGFTWGRHAESDIKIEAISILQQETIVNLRYKSAHRFIIPFSDRASVENCMHCITYMLLKEYSSEQIQEGISKLLKVRMRLELKKAINNCYLIDDVYNNDLAGLQIALEFLSHQNQYLFKSVIISDILQSALPEKILYQQVSELLDMAGVSKIIAIGPALVKYQKIFNIKGHFYENTAEFLQQFEPGNFKEEVILVKGARIFAFEKIVNALAEKIHGTQLEISMDALTSNLNFYRSRLLPQTKLMVMVKAFAYGSGILEVANLLQFHHIDYLGVAYADEGMVLRQNGIFLPIMVMNPTEDSFEKLHKYELEIVIYNLNILNQLIKFLNGKMMSVHLKLDTGMHRLGFEAEDTDALVDLLKNNRNIVIKSIFSHLVGSDAAAHNEFSKLQAQQFKALSEKIMKALDISPIRHLVNSPGIIRFPEFHFDMVRLGIGLYGLEANEMEQDNLQQVSKLKTIISQIREIDAGETVGYGRKGLAKNPMRIATIAIGYADGFSRAFSDGIGEVWLHGKRAPVIGNVCMDMTMIDITGIDAKEGDEVEIFGKHMTIAEVAKKINTIPYEILTNVSQRVKRIYYTE